LLAARRTGVVEILLFARSEMIFSIGKFGTEFVAERLLVTDRRARLTAADFREERTWPRNATPGGKRQSVRKRRL
jgi:hypothetical protein